MAGADLEPTGSVSTAYSLTALTVISDQPPPNETSHLEHGDGTLPDPKGPCED